LEEAIEFPRSCPRQNLLQLLKSLQRQQRGLAIVLDEYGGTAGVVTSRTSWRKSSAKFATKASRRAS
jgi:Mg2+/Co2+ transporter CorC